MLYALQQSLNALQLGSIYALIALGYTLVYSILRMINFAHGDLFMVGAFACFAAATFFKLPFAATLVLSMLVTAILGAGLERLAYRPLRDAPRVSAVITALGCGIFLEHFVLWLSPYPQHVPTLLQNQTWTVAGLSVSSIQMAIVAVAVTLMFALDFIVQHTMLGLAMRGISMDLRTVALMGVPVDRVIASTFALGAALGGAAGVLYSLAYPVVDPYMGVLMGWKAFIAAVIGGIGHVRGAVLGGFLLGAVEIFVMTVLPSTYRDLTVFTLMLALLVLRPHGFLGRPALQKV
ncbi:MAG TPA: branched-chain amino acid ABC transporter permease [Candidatus Limnocylindrales bacterium]|nr:branched-chain amino acid ABC transporter permease [Candidatus Limnocylindrales bacterium]